MKKRIFVANLVVALVSLVGLGCDEWLVGAPCVPETDNGEYTAGLEGSSYGIETRNVQCQGSTPMMCVTKTLRQNQPRDNDDLTDYEKQIAENGEPAQAKYSFCSCRCADSAGNKYDANSDKYDDLCECPSSTTCREVLGDNIDEAPQKIRGSYCIPKCIDEPGLCDEGKVCTPSSDSEKPWKWKCKVPSE